MAADDGDMDGNVKRIIIREFKISDKAFFMDVFCTEKEKLPLSDHMCHVVIGAVSPVTDKDGFATKRIPIAVNHVTEGPEFIFLVDRLDDGVRVGMLFKVVKGVEVHAVKPFCRMSFRDEILGGGERRLSGHRELIWHAAG